MLKRPARQLLGMPPNVRWEVTRRHPYYLLCWEKAVKYHCEPATSDANEQLLRYAAMAILNQIGVSGPPVDPSTSAIAALSPSCDFMGPNGSVQPMTFRTMVACLIQCLPTDERSCLASILRVSTSGEYAKTGDDESLTMQRQLALAELARLHSPALGSFARTSLFYIHGEASQRTITRDLSVVMAKLKFQSRTPEKRRSTDKFKKCMVVWDRREGWNGGGYDATAEAELREIARDLKEPISTSFSRYEVAFELVTGYAFEPNVRVRNSVLRAHDTEAGREVVHRRREIATVGTNPTASDKATRYECLLLDHGRGDCDPRFLPEQTRAGVASERCDDAGHDGPPYFGTGQPHLGKHRSRLSHDPPL